MRKLILGGTFNPIHIGHLVCSRAVAERSQFDQVVLTPTGQPPHKDEPANLAASADRLEMVRLAVANDAFFSVDDLEIRRGGKSYTRETATELRARGEKNINWLIGADMLLYLPQWRQIDQLLNEVNFIVMARPGWSIDWSALPPAFAHLKNNVVETPTISISATEIRQRVQSGLSIRYLTPDPVCRYIAQHGLYRHPPAAASPP